MVTIKRLIEVMHNQKCIKKSTPWDMPWSRWGRYQNPSSFYWTPLDPLRSQRLSTEFSMEKKIVESFRRSKCNMCLYVGGIVGIDISLIGDSIDPQRLLHESLHGKKKSSNRADDRGAICVAYSGTSFGSILASSVIRRGPSDLSTVISMEKKIIESSRRSKCNMCRMLEDNIWQNINLDEKSRFGRLTAIWGRWAQWQLPRENDDAIWST